MRLGRIITVGTAGVIVAALAYALWPKPVPVDVVRARRGDMAVTVDEDGRTRVKERYVVSSPLAAQLLRVELKAGDPVTAGQALAVMQPNETELLDPRARQEAEARVRAAEAALEQAGPSIQRAEAALELARVERQRLEGAMPSRVVSQAELDRAAYAERMRGAELETARFQERIARFELELARAALARSLPRSEAALAAAAGRGGGGGGAEGQVGGTDERFTIFAPVSGRVLRVYQESGAAMTAGGKILEVGDPADIEVEVDVLSADAVKIRPGDRVSLEHWGGERPLNGRVRVVEPSGFLKISALGVEEQRVWVIIDLVDPIESRRALGDGYRVETRIVVWEGRGVLTAPVGAVFRHEGGWAAYVVDGGRAVLRRVSVGHQNQSEVEVIDGVKEGDVVVVHPSERVVDGARVVERETERK